MRCSAAGGLPNTMTLLNRRATSARCSRCGIDVWVGHGSYGAIECAGDRSALSIVTGRNDLAAGPRDQACENADVEGRLQEVHGAVGAHGVGPARVEAVNLAVIGAIDGAGPGRRAL